MTRNLAQCLLDYERAQNHVDLYVMWDIVLRSFELISHYRNNDVNLREFLADLFKNIQ
jgi:hypothetical protein